MHRYALAVVLGIAVMSSSVLAQGRQPAGACQGASCNAAATTVAAKDRTPVAEARSAEAGAPIDAERPALALAALAAAGFLAYRRRSY